MDGEKEEECLWLMEGLGNLKISRKRTASEAEARDYDPYDSSEETLPPSSSSGWETQSKQSRLVSGEANKIVTEDDNLMAIILNHILTFPDEILRSATSVSKLWHKEIQRELRRRRAVAGHSFLMLWEAKHRARKFDYKTFLTFLINEPNDPVPLLIQAVIIIGSESIMFLDLPFDIPRRRGEINPLAGLPCTLAFADRVIVTTPDFRRTSRIGSKNNFDEKTKIRLPGTHACQALCIPYSDRLVMRPFTIPMWGIGDEVKEMEFENLRLELLQASMGPAGMSLQGIFMMFCTIDDFAIEKVIGNLLRLENRPIPFIGGTCDYVATSKVMNNGKTDQNSLAYGWVILGTSAVQVSTIVLEIQGIPFIENVLHQIGQYFLGAMDGFIFVYFTDASNSLDIINWIRSCIPTGIPVLGIRMDRLMFCPNASLTFGLYEPYIGPTQEFPSPVFDDRRIRTVCLLVRY